LITIIPPEQFKKTPWKNGKSETTELAINEGGTLDDFDWRLSMAKVVEDGAFSYFTGYCRNLILIEGSGITLQHDQSKVDQLDTLLDFATFDGGCCTLATLRSGPIVDINVITKAEKYQTFVKTFTDQQTVKLRTCTQCFIYCLNAEALLSSEDNSINTRLSAGHLMQLNQPGTGDFQVNGRNMIVIYLDGLE